MADFVRVHVRRAVESALGPGSLRFVARREMPQGELAMLEVVGGRKLIKVARPRSVAAGRFAAAHELGHHVLHHVDRSDHIEAEADRFAAALLMPWRAFHCMQNELGEELKRLAEVFQVTQTAVALRLGEVGRATAVVVVTPEHVRARSFGPMELPTPEDWRDYARMSSAELAHVGPGIRKTEITDGWKRVALLVGEEG